MNQSLQLNIIPFNHPTESASFAFYNNPALALQEAFFPILGKV